MPGSSLAVYRRLLLRYLRPLWPGLLLLALFLITSVGIVAMYASELRVSRMRRHGLEPPDDPDLGRPSH